MQTDMLTESQKSKFPIRGRGTLRCRPLSALEECKEDLSWINLEGGTSKDIKARDPNDVASLMVDELLKIKAGEMILTDIDKYWVFNGK